MTVPNQDMRVLLLILIRCIKVVGGGLKMLLYMLENWAKKGEIPKDLG